MSSGGIMLWSVICPVCGVILSPFFKPWFLFQGHIDYHHRELQHQLLCRICHFLNPGAHGMEEGSACRGGGRYRSVILWMSEFSLCEVCSNLVGVSHH